MSELFSFYSNNFEKNLSKIKNNFSEINNKQNNNFDFTLINDTFKLINESEKIIKQMELEISSIYDLESYKKYSTQLKEYQNIIHNEKKQLRKIEESLKDKENITLLGNNNSNNNIIQNETYSHLGNQKLEDIKRNLYSIEENGKQSLSSLEEQTNSMKGINVKIQGMNDDLESSNNLLNQMKDRIQRNKKQILIFGILLIFIISFIFVYKILNH
jgi:chromosome segregation ATPase